MIKIARKSVFTTLQIYRWLYQRFGWGGGGVEPKNQQLERTIFQGPP
jgi:hypothetical protein